MRAWLRELTAIALLVALFPQALASTQYVYDQLGRLTKVTEPDGSSATYSYDAAGNITSILRTPGPALLAITSFSPASGAPGTIVTIAGSGFSSIANQNTVQFNGVTAVVTSANTQQLVTSVPAGATSGPISVTTAAGSVTSASTFVVTSVSISGFSPAIGSAGNAVSVAGSGFEPVAGNNSIKFNVSNGAVTASTTTQLQTTVPAGATSGRITVTNSSGVAVSGSDFIVPPPGYAAGDIAMYGRMTPGGSGLVYTIGTANRVGAAFFDGAQGQRISVRFTNVSMGGSYRIYAPDGALLLSGNISNNLVVDMAPLPAAGTYSVFLLPGAATGSATIRILTDATGTVSATGVPMPLSLAGGQNAELTFSGVAGQWYRLRLTNFTSSPANGSLTATILKPDGTTHFNCQTYNATSGDCRFDVPTTGSYRLRLDPWAVHATSFDIRLVPDVMATLTPGTPLSVNLGAVGQNALLNFTATASQTFALNFGSFATAPANTQIYAYVRSSAGTVIAQAGNSNGFTFNLTNLAAGTYTVLIQPYNFATATLQVTLAPGFSGVLTADGMTSPTLTSSVPGQDGFFTFSATAGDNLGLGITSLAMTPSSVTRLIITVLRPNGSTLSTSYGCYTSNVPGCQVTLRNLPDTGTYTVQLTPNGHATTSLKLTLSQSVAGTLSPGTPLPVNLASPGQNAVLSFSAAAGQTFALNVASIATTPSNKQLYIYVYNAAGTQTEFTTTATGTTLNLTNLAAGTNRVLISPYAAATATFQVTLASALSGVLPSDGTTSPLIASSVPGQRGYFTFTANAGQHLGLGITNLAMTPSSVTRLILTVLRPNGSTLSTTYDCYASYVPGCQVILRNLPDTGTYTVVLEPEGYATMSLKLTLSQSVTGSLSADVPLGVNLAVPGQNAVLSFSATAGQTFALNVGSIATTPSNKQLYIYVYNAAGTQITSAVTSTGTTFNLTNLAAGTYTVLISPYMAATATAQVTLASALAGTLPADGTTSSTLSSTVPGQYGYFTFTAAAGQNLGLGITDLTMAPGSVTRLVVAVIRPNGSTLSTAYDCYVSNVPGCTITLRNLPATGTYTVQLSPEGHATMSLRLTLSQSVGGTLTPGSPLGVTLAAPGQNAVLSFTATAGQSVTLTANSFATVPANRSVYVYVYNAAGTQLAGNGGIGSVTHNLTSLAAGTYSVLIVPSYAATATLQSNIQ